ncbi:hypothetical protein HMPREF9622_01690 [Cutibacterium modestum HL037PA3]|uniref:Uncharacterized protein n=1 Tax=Cutibacterium modestum HL044PA1 TaxID=765109 RepID=A0ABN0C5U8_9ACTN|nr:hypothetical protein HMPREF9621_01525 [Cutibacterium modestum HL037PA2]EFS92569.1 hypothetical protein HMPREF9607_01099 [Cutibacterium modestum HL044PA1]EFT15324.1 hypothetical protein HMPREF9622_01690 [Cutibacterium modestum HL037PA3]
MFDPGITARVASEGGQSSEVDDDCLPVPAKLVGHIAKVCSGLDGAYVIAWSSCPRD